MSFPAMPFAVRQGPRTAALALLAMGAFVVLIGLSQPAWIDARVGPGLMMRGAGFGIVALAGLWLTLAPRHPVADRQACRDQAASLVGPLLLASVLAFAVLLPATGLVIAATIAAALAGLGAGERRPLALSVTALGLGGVAALIGMTLLPPTAPLWPGR